MEIEALQAIYLPHEFGPAEGNPWKTPTETSTDDGTVACGDAWTVRARGREERKERRETHVEAVLTACDRIRPNGDVCDDGKQIIIRPNEEDEEEETWSEVPVRVGLTFAHTKEYPHEPPLWRVHAIRGIGGNELDGMREELEEEVKNNLGMAMLFAMAATGKEWLREHLRKQNGMSLEGMGDHSRDWMQSRKEQEEEEEKKKMEARAHGIMVTPETFARWNEQFQAEQALERAKHMDVRTEAEKKKKATGRSYFEAGGKVEGDDLEGADEDDEELDEDELQQLDEELDDDDLLELEQLASEQIRVEQTMG